MATESNHDSGTPAETPNGDGSPFERFEALTKRLLGVPKAEVDEARKKRIVKRRKPAST